MGDFAVGAVRMMLDMMTLDTGKNYGFLILDFLTHKITYSPNHLLILPFFLNARNRD